MIYEEGDSGKSEGDVEVGKEDKERDIQDEEKYEDKDKNSNVDEELGYQVQEEEVKGEEIDKETEKQSHPRKSEVKYSNKYEPEENKKYMEVQTNPKLMKKYFREA